MTYYGYGRVIKGVGGLFTVRLLTADSALLPPEAAASREENPLDGCTVFARGRGHLRAKGSLLVGDLVRVGYDDTAFSRTAQGELILSEDGGGIAIEEILPRSCGLIRPPMANLNYLFVTLAAASPAPIPETVDKLISIAEFNHIEPVIVITKSDLAPDAAASLADCYRTAGFCVFCQGLDRETDALKAYILGLPNGSIAAFSGASGVGKSTLLNRLFPSLGLETGEISRRIERGKNTTRCVELYPLSNHPDGALLADTPGFTMLDFERFDFFDKEDLPTTFREFLPYIGQCRYTKCSHTKEQGCAVLEAMSEGKIPPSRHQSFLSLYEVLKKKTKW
ncbi:MAG: ribosome small subunit-dependent GTPase A [Clostridia bacterium]|nr:ribosome small subunit-dependent GTPase A [Clostridia bacterium]